MKIILTGSTGGIGSEVLRQCLNSPKITSIIVLSRRDIPEDLSRNVKVKVIIMTDFSVYSSQVIEQLAGAEACIWYAYPSRHDAQYHILNMIESGY